MILTYIRSIIFAVLFYGLTILICLVPLPTLFMPRRFCMGVVRVFVTCTGILERTILGLHYEVRGAEHLPQGGSYIVAAKHQSAYETIKLHNLFRDPAVILKKELLRIPLWGWFLGKSDVIAIDRSSREAASKSIQDGARRVMAQGRPIVIFPQGTRVAVDVSAQEKPYKVGVARIQDATGLPIIPMAMNAGLFWPRNSFWKSPGKVVFEFLPPIAPGMERGELMRHLETQIEEASARLVDEARNTPRQKSKGFIWIFAAVLLAFCAYSAYWFTVADRVKAEYIALSKGKDEPVISGYPLRMKAVIAREEYALADGVLQVNDVTAQGWPLPKMPIDITTGALRLNGLDFESLNARFIAWGDHVEIKNSTLIHGETKIHVTGTLDTSQQPIPKPDIILSLENHEEFIQRLQSAKMINRQAALFASSGLTAFKDSNGIVRVPLHQKANAIYAGPIPIYKLPMQQDYTGRTKPPVP